MTGSSSTHIHRARNGNESSVSSQLSDSNESVSRQRRNSNSSDTSTDPKRKKGVGCGEICLMIIKCLGTTCYVFCPPVPELITRKIAFHPPPRGYTYNIVVTDLNSNRIQVKNAAKAMKYLRAQIEPTGFISGSRLSMEGIETLFIKTHRGSCLTTVLVRNGNEHVDSVTEDVVVLFSQPNGSDLGCYLQREGLNLRWLADELNVDVYAYDYSGFGASTGRTSEKNIYYDIEAVYEYIRLSRGPSTRIVLLGFSIGTAPSIKHASRHPPNLCGLVLVAPFTSGWRLVFHRDPKLSRCCLDRFLSYERAPDIDVPVLVCHGHEDLTVPIEHSMALLPRLKRAVRPLFISNASHLSIFSKQHRVVFSRIRYFLREQIDPLH